MNPDCPACAIATRPVQVQQVPCFECGRCRGHFIRGEALDAFLTERDLPNGHRRLMERALQAPASTRNLKCPACRAPSYRVVSSGLIAIDVCDLCVGVYFDRSEANVYLLQTRGTTKVVNNTTDAADDVASVLHTIYNLFD